MFSRKKLPNGTENLWFFQFFGKGDKLVRVTAGGSVAKWLKALTCNPEGLSLSLLSDN